MTNALALQSARRSATDLWRAYPREIVGFGLLGLVGALALGGVAASMPTLGGVRDGTVAEAAPPAPPPLIVRELPPEKALAVNGEIPLAGGPNPPARPFSMAGADPRAFARALDCLTSAVYYEAGQESTDGQRGVAQVVLNRVRHPAFPASVCAVVYQGSTRPTGCQFTFTCDGSLARAPMAAAWARARKVAEAALKGYVHAPVGWATHYHANYVVPYWAPTLAKNAVIGTHIFYRWAGAWGRPDAFVQRYAKAEPDSGALRLAALQADVAHARAAAAELAAGKTVEIADASDLEAVEDLLATAPQKGGRRVAVRFATEAARDAVEKAPRTPYVEKVAASSTLRYALGGDTAAGESNVDTKPLGRVAESAAAEAPGTSDQ